MTEPKPSCLAAPSQPRLRLPAGACDAHVQVFGPHRISPYAADTPGFYKFSRKIAGS